MHTTHPKRSDLNHFVSTFENNKLGTTCKEDVDYQFWNRERNKVIDEYKNMKDNYSWDNEVEGEVVYSDITSHQLETNKSPTVYDLREIQKYHNDF